MHVSGSNPQTTRRAAPRKLKGAEWTWVSGFLGPGNRATTIGDVDASTGAVSLQALHRAGSQQLLERVQRWVGGIGHRIAPMDGDGALQRRQLSHMRVEFVGTRLVVRGKQQTGAIHDSRCHGMIDTPLTTTGGGLLDQAAMRWTRSSSC